MGRAGSPLLIKGTMRYGTVPSPLSRHLQGIRTDMSSWRHSFAGRIKGAKSGSENSLRLPAATAKVAYFLRGVYFADARERFTGPARTFFSFSAGKRRMLLLGGREAVNEGGSEGL